MSPELTTNFQPNTGPKFGALGRTGAGGQHCSPAFPFLFCSARATHCAVARISPGDFSERPEFTVDAIVDLIDTGVYHTTIVIPGRT